MTKPFDYERIGYDLHEFFADEFACALLMPADDILARRAEGASVTELAERYDVTTGAVKAWLKRLDKHPPETDKEITTP